MHITLNGQTQTFTQTTLSVSELVAHLQATGKRIAVERNGEIVPHSQFESTQLQAGDVLEIVGAVGGG
jgi:sulfur carrier protein